MARYTTVTPTTTTASTATIAVPQAGQFTKLTGTSYTVTIGDPALLPGASQVFYNAASGTVSLQSGGSGTFIGPGSSGTSTQGIVTGTTLTVYSDGTNWVTFGAGGAGSFTTLTATQTVTLSPANYNVAISPSGTGTLTMSPVGGLTINPTAAGSVNNVNIGASTRGTGAFTTLAANGAVTMSAGTDASSNSVGGTLTVTGGGAFSGKVYSGGGFFGALTGNVTGSSTSCSGAAASAGAVSTTNDNSTNATYYPVFSTSSTDQANSLKLSSSKFSFNPSTGTMTATIVTASSDARLKENVKPLTGALALVKALEGVEFNRIGSTTQEIGVIAQQVEKVVPQLVFTDDSGMKSVAYANTVALLIEAIKEQQVQIEELKQRIV